MPGFARAIDHQPVLYLETLDLLAVRPGGCYADCTVGSGGHALGILERSAPDGRLLALDADPDALAVARQRLSAFAERVVLVHSNYAKLQEVARQHGFASVHGILFDLGLSSRQLSAEGRGFSLQEDAPLDMRLDPSQATTAADLVNGLSEQELADLIYRQGDEPASRRIAKAIVAARPIRTTSELVTAIERAVHRRGKLHPATKTFMALRRSVNAEGEALKAALPQAVNLLAAGSRLAVISFHSGEDRIVKEFMRRESRERGSSPELLESAGEHRPTLQVITRHVIVATDNERKQNPRSRSARLRVAERLSS
jgi:16S rRNA (cytosine1402-N4)-methyltransferase